MLSVGNFVCIQCKFWLTPFEVYFPRTKLPKGKLCGRVDLKVKWRRLTAGDSLYITHCHIYNHLFCEQMIWGMLPWWGNNMSFKWQFSYNISAAQCLWMDICSFLCCVLSVMMLKVLPLVEFITILAHDLTKYTFLHHKNPWIDILETDF